MFKNPLTKSVLLAAIFLTGCGENQETYTIDYLLDNDDIRIQVLADCKENNQTAENCKNANDAENRKKAMAFNQKSNH